MMLKTRLNKFKLFSFKTQLIFVFILRLLLKTYLTIKKLLNYSKLAIQRLLNKIEKYIFAVFSSRKRYFR